MIVKVLEELRESKKCLSSLIQLLGDTDTTLHLSGEKGLRVMGQKEHLFSPFWHTIEEKDGKQENEDQILEYVRWSDSLFRL